jgi:hypothetical protein
MEASSALSVEAQTEPGTYFDEAAKPTGEVQAPGSMSPTEVTEATQEFVAGHEGAVADPPAPVEPAPEAQATPDPVAAKVFLSDGQIHLLADRAELVEALSGATGTWLTLTRQNGSQITVRESAITSYE